MKQYGSKFFWILAVTLACAWAYAKFGVSLGMDLSGGSSVLFRATADGGLDAAKLEKARKVIEDRVNRTGLAEVYVSSTVNNEILLEMPGRSDAETDAIKALVQRNGELEFRIVAQPDVTTRQRNERNDGGPRYIEPDDLKWYPVADDEKRGDFADGFALLEVPERKVERDLETLRRMGASPEKIAEKERELETARSSFVFRGEDLKRVGVESNLGQIYVTFELKETRKSHFGEFTGDKVNRRLAIILDGKLTSAPNIESRLDGNVQIKGSGKGFTMKEAEDLSIVLESGSTGVRLELMREEKVGPSLGRDAIERGQWSIGIGFGAVLVLMLWWYRVPGLVAIVALFLNLVIMLGALAFFRAALSLPGIAGIVLTLGMAVDANVLIFERLRDERARGKSLDESLAAGYDRAMSAIIDSNVTTILTAIVLIAMGTGAVRGFGVTLTIGLLASMFTGIYVTRAIFEWAVDKGVLKTFAIGPDPFQPKIDYMSKRRMFTGPSIALVVLGVVAFMARDENDAKDIEFVGGQQAVVQLRESVTAAEISKSLQSDPRFQGAAAVRLEPIGIADPGSGASNRYQVRVKAPDKQLGDAFLEHIEKVFEGRLVDRPFDGWTRTGPDRDGKHPVAFTMNLLTPTDPAALKSALDAQGLASVAVSAPDGAASSKRLQVSVDGKDSADAEIIDKCGRAVRSMKLEMSEPLPSSVFLAKGPAEDLWRTAVEAVLISLIIQMVYIRLRFADYAHGFSAVIALVHDVAIALGAVAICDGAGLVYAKVNLTLIAAFLTLIGYSMNDTIVTFDRMRENMGKSGVLRARIINDSINQTFARSIRTAVTTWIVVLVQFLFNRGIGSVLEGFAWVMVVGCVAGAYSSIFMAAPMLLFLPGYGKILGARKGLLAVQLLLTLVGGIVALTSEGHGLKTWIGLVLAMNIPLHFLFHFLPWLGHPDPDSLVVEAQPETERDRPLDAPGI
ncbi:MAG: hypothetical protein HMLKMBBP_00441 [Planctomycetes bacterium]|nr:hypothetical protein [Planctomycetota bacterium]